MQATKHKTYTHLSCKRHAYTYNHTHCITHTSTIKIHERHTQSKGEDRSTALARSVVVTYYWGLKPVYARTTSLLFPILTYFVINPPFCHECDNLWAFLIHLNTLMADCKARITSSSVLIWWQLP